MEESPPPADAVPLRAAPAGTSGSIAIGFEGEVSLEQLLPAIEQVTARIRERPGPLPVVIDIPVAGATRQLRLPVSAEWDEGLAESLQQAAGLPVAVRLVSSGS